MRSRNPGRHLFFFLVKYPVEWRQNHVWGPIFDPSYDNFYKCDHFGKGKGKGKGKREGEKGREMPVSTPLNCRSIRSMCDGELFVQFGKLYIACAHL